MPRVRRSEWIPSRHRRTPRSSAYANRAAGGMRPSTSFRLIGRKDTLVTPEEAVLKNFMRDGRIVSMPAKRSRRVVLLNHVAQMFEVGVRYSEGEVNRKLRNVHDDYAALRRYLIDEGFMSRDRGEYWRSGGSVDT